MSTKASDIEIREARKFKRSQQVKAMTPEQRKRLQRWLGNDAAGSRKKGI